MNKKLLIGIIIVIVVLVIAAAILGNLVYLYLLAAWIPEAIPLAVWIYLVWMVRKKKTKIFPDQMESKLAESRLKRLKVFLLVGGISLAVGIVGVILHGVLGILLEIEEEPVSFFIALVGFWAFFIATIGGLVIFLKGRRKTT
ncbi:MAG: hypothetical protein ACETVS_01220 [Dehalococcoidales bacterium]